MKRHIQFSVLLLLSAGIVAACGETGSEETPTDSPRATSTDNEMFYVEYTPNPDPIPHNDLFSIDVSVWESEARETLATDAVIDVSATMPAHGHGMTTEPQFTNHDDGTFMVEGMKFHMESPTPEEKWVIHVDVTSGSETDRANFDVMCCGQ